MKYEAWCKSVGIIPDEESREAWDYQEKRFNDILDKIEDMIIEADDSPKMILHEPFSSLLNSVGSLREGEEVIIVEKPKTEFELKIR